MTIKELKAIIKDIPNDVEVFISDSASVEDGNDLIREAVFVEDAFLVTHSSAEARNGFYLVRQE